MPNSTHTNKNTPFAPNLTDALKHLPMLADSIFSGKHHARYIEPDVPYHVITRTFQGRCLLTPTRALNNIIAGVIGRAQLLYPHVHLYAYAFLSNHAHLLMQGPPDQMVDFIAFVKREISRRHGRNINWHEAMWNQFVCAALPSPASQVACFKYILGQGVKEGLVRRPEDWPGVHVAKQYVGRNPQPLNGEWFNGTDAAIVRAHAKYIENRRKERKLAKAEKHTQKNNKKSNGHQHNPSSAKLDLTQFKTTYQVRVEPLPPWADLSEADYRAQVVQLCKEITHEACVARKGAPVLGVQGILKTPIDQAFNIVVPAWLEGRRSILCWSAVDNGETEKYVERYWAHQRAFREASDAYLAGQDDVRFPPLAFKPMVSEVRLMQRRLARLVQQQQAMRERVAPGPS